MLFFQHLLESLVRGHVVDTDTEYCGAGLPKAQKVVGEFAGFFCASRRLVFRIEIQDDPLAAIVFQLMPMAILILQLEVWRGAADTRNIRMRDKRAVEQSKHANQL